MPVLNTGMRCAQIDIVTQPSGVWSAACSVNFSTGLWSLVHISPASKNGDSSTGRNGMFSRPNSLVPMSGIRSSALNTAIRLPMRRSNTGQDDVDVVDVVVHSLTSNELYRSEERRVGKECR